MKILKTSLLALLATSPAYAVTTFTNAIDTDANNVGNWSGGFPTGTEDNAVIAAGATATTSANFGSDGEGFHLAVDGTLNVSSSHTLNLGNGFASPSGGIITVNNGGILNISGTALVLGVGADTRLTPGGAINILSGGKLDERKNLVMSGGTITYEVGSLGNNSTGFSLTGTTTSTIAFDVASGVYTAAAFDTNANLDSAGGINLFADMTGATAGDTYTVLTVGTKALSGTFDAFTYNIDSGLAANVTYTGNSATINVTAIPEPSSTALLGLGGLALILRRRK